MTMECMLSYVLYSCAESSLLYNMFVVCLYVEHLRVINALCRVLF